MRYPTPAERVQIPIEENEDKMLFNGGIGSYYDIEKILHMECGLPLTRDIKHSDGESEVSGVIAINEEIDGPGGVLFSGAYEYWLTSGLRFRRLHSHGELEFPEDAILSIKSEMGKECASYVLELSSVSHNQKITIKITNSKVANIKRAIGTARNLDLLGVDLIVSIVEGEVVTIHPEVRDVHKIWHASSKKGYCTLVK